MRKIVSILMSLVIFGASFAQTAPTEAPLPPPPELLRRQTQTYPVFTPPMQTPTMIDQGFLPQTEIQPVPFDDSRETSETLFRQRYEFPVDKLEPSRIEKLYERVVKLYETREPDYKLRQFGYDLFRRTPTFSGAVPDSYILGPGDELIIYLWGSPVDMGVLRERYTVKVSRNGSLYLPNLGLYSVSSMKLEAFKDLIQREYGRKFKNVKTDAVLNRMRSMRIYVSGFVAKPGLVSATPLDTLMTVLSYAGGVTKEGSLRRIEIRRREGNRLERIPVDLYDLLIGGLPVDIRLRDEDVIYVPAIGSVIAVDGDVKRPAIYEINQGESIEKIIGFAGGVKPSASEVFVRLYSFGSDGVRVLESSLKDEEFMKKQKTSDGDLLFVGRKPNVFENGVKVSGSVHYPGVYSIVDTKNLKDLLEKSKPLVTANYGRVVSLDKKQKDFLVREILEGKYNLELKPRDEVYIYDRFPVEPVFLSGEVKEQRSVPYYEGMTLLDLLKDVEYKSDIRLLKATVYRKVKVVEEADDKNQSKSPKGDEEKKGEKQQDEKKREKQQDITITVYLNDLLLRNRENQNLKLMSGDVVVIERAETLESTNYVTIIGEVRKPGRYSISGNEKLYDLIQKAGGYTERAYPKGLILIRESAKKLQKEQLEIALTSLEEALLKQSQRVSFASEEERQALLMTIDREQRAIEILRRRAALGLGRIALKMPESLEELKKSPTNIELSDEDLIIVPARPNYILVFGDVYNQISLPYIKGQKVRDYLNMVGGPKRSADTRDIYIIKADGTVVSSQSQGRGFLLGSRIEDYVLEEGDAIVVPSEFRVPVQWRILIKDVVQIIFQSISTAVLAKRL